jgi:hypothetical protein
MTLSVLVFATAPQITIEGVNGDIRVLSGDNQR